MKIGGKKTEGVVSGKYVNKTGGGEKVKKPDPGPPSSSEGDSVDLSTNARDFSRVKSMLNSVPDVRAEAVVKIKTDIEKGDYSVDAEKVAEKMIERSLKNALYTNKK